jgi:hypothetical protein
MHSLEGEPPNDLHDARIRGTIHHSGLRVVRPNAGVHAGEDGMIGNIERFCAELEVNLFSNGEGLNGCL